MNNEFVSYEQSLSLKEIGFNEPCIGNFADDDDHTLFINGNRPGKTNAPLKSQVFRWFRENHDLFGWVKTIYSYGEASNKFEIIGKCFSDTSSNFYDNPEEAEDACINKLIELVKQQ